MLLATIKDTKKIFVATQIIIILTILELKKKKNFSQVLFSSRTSKWMKKEIENVARIK